MVRVDRIAQPQSGVHEREAYVRVVIGLCRARETGRLSIENEEGKRTLYLLEGMPLDYRSDVPGESLSEDLVEAGLIPSARVGWFRERLSAGEHLEDALLMSGVITQEQLDNVKALRIQRGLGAPLGWSGGRWEFQPAASLRAGAVDARLRPDVPVLQTLWTSVCERVDMDEVLPLVTSRSAGAFLPTTELAGAVELLALAPPLSDLPRLLGNGCGVEQLARHLPEKSGDLVRLLWFFEAGDILRRGELDPGRSESDGSLASKAVPGSATEEPGTTGPVIPAAPPATADTPASPLSYQPSAKESLAEAYQHRIGQDYYAFLAISRDTEPQDLKLVCRELAQRWHAMSARPDLDNDDRARLQHLLRGVQQIWSTFTDTKRKSTYDAQLAEGTAPRVEVEGAIGQAAQPTRGFRMGRPGTDG